MNRLPVTPYGSYNSHEKQSASTYAPRSNHGLARVHPPEVLTEEYMKLLPYRDAHPMLPDRDPLEYYRGPTRKLSIVSDTFIDLEGQPLELFGDARFVFNALATFRYAKQSTLDIINFGSGFRGEQYESTSYNNVSAHFSRAIQALDAVALEISDDILVERTSWGSGHGSYYFIKPDIKIHDRRS